MSVKRSGLRTGGVTLSPTAARQNTQTASTRGVFGRLGAWVDAHGGWLLVGMIALYVAAFATLSCLKLAWFRQGFDMAGNEQTIWNTLHGRPFRISVFAMMDYDFDDGPVLLQLPLALLYGIYQSPYTLLVLQTLALGLAAWPLYLLGRDALGVPWQALVLVAVYMLHPTTQHINMYEFQLRSFMIPFALGALLFLKRGQFWPYALMLFLMLSTKTEAGFTLVMFGLYALWLRRRWPFAVFPLVVGPAWVAIALGVIVPQFSQGDFAMTVYFKSFGGDSIGEVIWNILNNPMLLMGADAGGQSLLPQKLTFLGQLFGLQGFLALLSPTSLLSLPVLLLNLITPNRVQWSLNYQYPALVYPFLLVGAAEGLARLGRLFGRPTTNGNRKLAADHKLPSPNTQYPTPNTRTSRVQAVGMGVLLVIALVANVQLNNVVQSLLRVRETPERVAAANALIAQVPPDAPLAATSFLGPHLAQREQIYFFPGNLSYPQSYIDRAEYIAADSRPPGGNRQVIELLQKYMQNPAWELVAQEGDFVLLRKR